MSDIDVREYAPLVTEAKSAFNKDTSYFESMFISAFRSKLRFIKGLLRKELREAEVEARTQCVASDIRACYNVSPCGTGHCPFAKADLVNLRVQPIAGKINRPQRKARITVGISTFSIPITATVYENPTNLAFKLVNTAAGWRMYREDSIRDMQASDLYQELISRGELVLSSDNPSEIRLDTFVDSYDIENAIEPLMKLRRINL